MSVKNSLTNEELHHRFDNAFAIVLYAIKMARSLVSRGEEFHTNPANEILEKIVDGCEEIDDEEFEEEEETEEEVEE